MMKAGKEQIEKMLVELICIDLLEDERKMNQIDGNSEFFKDIEMDSILVVSLFVLVEEKFHLNIEDVTEFTECLTDVDSLTEYIYKKQND